MAESPRLCETGHSAADEDSRSQSRDLREAEGRGRAVRGRQSTELSTRNQSLALACRIPVGGRSLAGRADF
ncbi:hypothetical protein MPTK1_7g15270 [Marchantia polymorpha subsp. ruderalis]